MSKILKFDFKNEKSFWSEMKLIFPRFVSALCALACHLSWEMSFQWGPQKLLQGLVSHELTAYFSVFNLFLTQLFMVILSKECRPDKFELRNSLKLSFIYIRGFCSNFVECGSFLETNSLDILAPCEPNLMTQLILAIFLCER